MIVSETVEHMGNAQTLKQKHVFSHHRAGHCLFVWSFVDRLLTVCWSFIDRFVRGEGVEWPKRWGEIPKTCHADLALLPQAPHRRRRRREARLRHASRWDAAERPPVLDAARWDCGSETQRGGPGGGHEGYWPSVARGYYY